MGTLIVTICKGPSEDVTCKADTSDKKEQVTEIIARIRPLSRVRARLVEETERQEWPMNRNHPLANLSKACSKDEWNKMGMSLGKFKILCKTEWIARTSILWRKTPTLHVISLRKFRIIVSFIHVSSPTPSSSKDQRTKELTYPGPQQWLLRAQPISPGDATCHPYIRLLGTRLPTSFLGLTHLTTGNLQYLLTKPIAHSLM